jgi:hypothetical protein
VSAAINLGMKLASIALLGVAFWLWFWRSEGWAGFFLLVFAVMALFEGGKWFAQRSRQSG